MKYVDPSGYFFSLIAAIVGIAAGIAKIASVAAAVVSVAATAASAISHLAGNHSLGNIFGNIGQISGWVGLGTGVASAGLSIIGGLASEAASAGAALSSEVTGLTGLKIGSPYLQGAVKSAFGSLISSGVGAGSAVISNMMADATADYAPKAWNKWSNFITADSDSVAGMTWSGIHSDFVTDDPGRAVRMLDEFTGVPSVVKTHFSVGGQPGLVKTKAWGKVATNIIPVSKALRVTAKIKIGRSLPSFSRHGYKYLRSSAKFL